MTEYIPLEDLDPDEEDKNEDKDDDDDEDSDQEINNPSESTPKTTMNRDYGKEGARPKTAETSFIEGETQGRKTWGNSQSLTKDAWDDLSILYPNAEDDKLEASFFKDKIEVRMKKSGKKFYPLMTKEQTSYHHISFSCLVAHRAFTELLHSSLLVAAVRTSSHDLQPASCLSFSTVRLQVVFGLPLLLLPSGAQLMATLQSSLRSFLSRRLCNVATPVKRPYVPVAYLHGVFRVYQWLDQPRGGLLALAPVRH